MTTAIRFVCHARGNTIVYFRLSTTTITKAGVGVLKTHGGCRSHAWDKSACHTRIVATADVQRAPRSFPAILLHGARSCRWSPPPPPRDIFFLSPPARGRHAIGRRDTVTRNGSYQTGQIRRVQSASGRINDKWTRREMARRRVESFRRGQ